MSFRESPVVYTHHWLESQPAEIQSLNGLAEDEPYFINRTDDPLPGSLVELHASIGAGVRKRSAS